MMDDVRCLCCGASNEEREQLHVKILELTAQVKELVKVNELQAADLARLRKVLDSQRQPNRPERVKEESLQLAFASVVKELASRPLAEAAQAANQAGAAAGPSPSKPRRKGNRRELLKAGLPIVDERIVPEEVQASGGVGWSELEPEVTERVVFRRARFEVIRTTRTRWVRQTEGEGVAKGSIVAAPVPDWALPSMMADSSVIAEVAMNKYGFSLPLYRQERMTDLRGFAIARSTQYDWCEYGALKLAPIVAAMHRDAIANSFMIATDASSAPVRSSEGTIRWHIFVFISDVGHISFQAVRHHDSESVEALLKGFTGRLLSDASSVYNGLHMIGIIELACWAHIRRYFWKATLTETQLAHEALSLIAALFRVVAQSNRISNLTSRGEFRVKHATPIIDSFDAWMEQARPRAEEGGRIEKALNYATNLREARRAFLADPRLKIHNNESEQALRALKKGLDNWMHFETKAGLKVYTVFRSLIASCTLHHLNPYDYIEEVLRLVRHWPADRMLELAPMYWRTTRSSLDEKLRRAIDPPWRKDQPVLLTKAA